MGGGRGLEEAGVRVGAVHLEPVVAAVRPCPRDKTVQTQCTHLNKHNKTGRICVRWGLVSLAIPWLCDCTVILQEVTAGTRSKGYTDLSVLPLTTACESTITPKCLCETALGGGWRGGAMPGMRVRTALVENGLANVCPLTQNAISRNCS